MTVPRRKYPDQCEREQSRLGQFAWLGLAGEETGDNKSGSDSSHAEEFWFRVGFKRDGRCIRDGGCVLSPLDSGRTLSSSVGICKEIYLITVGLTEANVATVLAGWLSK